jgi:hypothetical protein
MANPNPYKNITDLQTAWMEAWAQSVRNAFQCWCHMFEMQQGFLKHVEKHHRDHIEIACGASFLDKYGRRAHDIDPEHDV